MYFQFQLRGLKAIKISDNSLNPFDRDIEVFQTWQIHATQSLMPSDQPPVYMTRCGFSTTGGYEDGVRFRKGDSRQNLFDPTISFSLPSMSPDEPPMQFQIDFHFWESDNAKSTKKVRALYSNDLLKHLIKTWEDASQDSEKALQDVLGFFSDENKMIKAITNTMSYTSIGNAPWVRVAEELYPLVLKIGKLISANSTDYIAQQTYWLEIRNNEGVYEWRFFSNDLDKIVFDWQVANGKLVLPNQVITDANNNIELDVTFQGVIHD